MLMWQAWFFQTETEVTRQVINRKCHEENQRERCSREWLEWETSSIEAGVGLTEDPPRDDV